MNGLLSFLIKEGMQLLIVAEMRRAIRRLTSLLALYAVLAALALVAIAFLYVLLYQFLAERLDSMSAAAIISGGNLILIALILGIRALVRSGGRKAKSHRLSLADSAIADSAELSHSALDAGIVLGQAINEKARRAAPQIALVAALIGVVIGARPQILGLFRRSSEHKRRD